MANRIRRPNTYLVARYLDGYPNKKKLPKIACVKVCRANVSGVEYAKHRDLAYDCLPPTVVGDVHHIDAYTKALAIAAYQEGAVR